jgi:2-polyprenyl-6-methoxyphenol hydroxylase-like FAD-dependent oxidoreductase
MAQQLGSGSLNVSFWSARWGEVFLSQFDKDREDIEEMKAACLKELADWDTRLRRFIEYADSGALARNLYMLRIGITWAHRPGVTVLGDAAHVMTPFAGEGVNLAMSDAMSLARAIETASQSGELSKEIQAYEEDMFKRAKVVQQQTYDMMSATFFEEGGITMNIERYIIAAAGDEMPWWLKPAFWVLLRCGYTFWRWWNPPPTRQRREVKEG